MAAEKQQKTQPATGPFVFTSQDVADSEMAKPASGNFLFSVSNQHTMSPKSDWDKIAERAKISLVFGEVCNIQNLAIAIAINTMKLAHVGFLDTGFSDRVQRM